MFRLYLLVIAVVYENLYFESCLDKEVIVFVVFVRKYELLNLPCRLVFSFNFSPQVCHTGSLVKALLHLCAPPWSLPWSASETALYFFLFFCRDIVHHKGTKVTEPDSGGSQIGKKTNIFGAFLTFFGHMSKTALTISLKFCV